MTQKAVPLGITDFGYIVENEDLLDQEYIYVDKTMLIEEILRLGSRYILITRPRRFGKTLNLSMLQHFFSAKVRNRVTAHLFDNLKISKSTYMQFQGKHPVVFISFKDIKNDNWEKMLEAIKDLIKLVLLEHQYLETSEILSEKERNYMRTASDFMHKMTDSEAANALTYLMRLLSKHYKEKVVLLIDEYDTPIIEGYLGGFYRAVVKFIQVLFGTLKDNMDLFKCVFTGITRVSKESLFSGLNQVSCFSVMDKAFNSRFGFTEEELAELCPVEHMPEVKRWYNGYKIGGVTIYNPWSVMNFIVPENEFDFRAYWVNTSSNNLVGELIQVEHLKALESLIEGESVKEGIDDSIVFESLKKSKSALWSMLLSAGYLTSDDEGGLCIPNYEIRTLYETIVKQWFFSENYDEYFTGWKRAILSGNVSEVKKYLLQVMDSVSYHDVGPTVLSKVEPETDAFGNPIRPRRAPEKFGVDEPKTHEAVYHALMLGLVVLFKTHKVVSNREAGYGRFDILMSSLDIAKYPDVIIEVKTDLKEKKLTKAAKDALTQIFTKQYLDDTRTQVKYGVAFNGKIVEVVV